MKKWIITASLTASLLTLGACETNETLGREQLLLVDDKALEQSALTAWQENLKTAKISRDAVLNKRVQSVGARIVTAAGMNDRPWEYVLFENDEPNAFVIPGNKVGVNTGLFKVVSNDDQLAAVIGHETAHVIAHHAAERYSQQMATQLGLEVATGVTKGKARDIIGNYGGLGAQLGFLLPYSRKHELEADKIGVDLTAKAGFKPSQAVQVWRNMATFRQGKGAPEFMSTHPSDETRIHKLETYILEKGYK